MPTSLRARLRRHLGWPLLLLLASLGVAGALAVQAQRAASSHRRTAARLLHDYASIAAWSYGRRVEEALVETGTQVLGPILHRELHPAHLDGWPRAASLAAYRDSALAWCRCDPGFRPSLYLSWTLGDARGTGSALPAGDEPADGATVLGLMDAVTRHVRSPEQPRDRAALLTVPRDGAPPTLLAYGLMPTEWGDTIAYAFTYDEGSLDEGFRALVSHELLPHAVTRGVPNEELLAVRVATADGAPLFTDTAYPEPRWPYQADGRLTARAGALRLQAAVRPAAADRLVDGALGGSRAPLLAVLVALAAALALVAVRQLRREQELARLRADFVASVSHELRTPLAQMRLFLETLRLGRWRTAEQRDWLLGHADREATRLSHLVENVLTFARMGRGGAAVAPAALAAADVGAEVEEAVRAFQPLADARGITLDVRTERATARLERASFRQLVLNLLDNAAKYGPPGGTVAVRVAGAAGSGPVVRLLVDDEGPGVPAAERARVWAPFARGDGDAVRACGGSGIGLAIVREVVTAHGGRAWLDDAPGGGARVVVELPAVSSAPVAAEASAPSAAGAPTGAEPAEVG
jgi:signal transduction histidine kinase